MVVVDNFLGPFQPTSFYDPVTPYLDQYINRCELAGRVQFAAQGQAAYWSAGGETLLCASLVFFGILFLSPIVLPFHYNYLTNFTTTTIIIIIQSLNYSFFNLQVLIFFFCSLILLPIPPGVEVCGLGK